MTKMQQCHMMWCSSDLQKDIFTAINSVQNSNLINLFRFVPTSSIWIRKYLKRVWVKWKCGGVDISYIFLLANNKYLFIINMDECGYENECQKWENGHWKVLVSYDWSKSGWEMSVTIQTKMSDSQTNCWTQKTTSDWNKHKNQWRCSLWIVEWIFF